MLATMATPRKTTKSTAKPTASGRPSTRRKAPAKAASAPPRTLTEIGRDAQRSALLEELERQSWNLTGTAKALGLVNASNVKRALLTLGLEGEYDAAKAAGKIVPGRHAESD
jgi:transcriptional regulator with GAF, ATPase, and Fis domain